MGSYFSWIGSSGSFGSAAKWRDLTTPSKTGVLAPGTNDSADFSTSVTSGADITGSGSVNSLTIEGKILLDGTFTAGSIANAGTVTIRSGKLSTANTIVDSGLLTISGGTVSATYVTDAGQIVLTGGSLTASGFIGDNGTLNVAGPAVLTDTGGLGVGDAVAGSLSVSAGGTVSAGYSIIGNQAGVAGNATVAGTGATWTNTGSLIVGNGGNGTLAVNTGGRVSAQLLELAAVAGVTGSVTVSGATSSVTATQVVDVGYAGRATMSVQNGATLSNAGLGEAGALAGSNGTVTITGTGSSWKVGTSLLIGNAGTGSLSVTSHGTATAHDLAVGYLAGSTGTLTIDGSGSLVNIAQTVNIGSSGAGTLGLTNAGTLIAGSFAQLGATAGSAGGATIDGAGSLLQDGGTFNVGGAGAGTLTLRNHGALTAANLVLAAAAGGSGTVTVTGGGASVAVTQNVSIGYAGSAALSITGGAGMTTSGMALLGVLAGAAGSVTIDGAGSSWQVTQQLADGAGGTGSLTVSNGGKLALGADLAVGIGANAMSASGQLSLLSGGTVTTSAVEIGDTSGSQGIVTVSGAGSLLSATSAVYVGGSAAASGGTGELDISAGGTVSSPVAEIWNSGVVTLTQASLLATTATILGTLSGNGALSASSQIINSGTINAVGGTLTITGGIAGTGMLNVAAGAVLLLGGSVAATQTIAFASSGLPGTLALAAPLQVAATIDGFASGDRIELVGITATQLQYANGVLTAIGPGGAGGTSRTVATLDLAGTYALNSFTLTQDAQGDSFISSTAYVPTASDYLQAHKFFSASSPWNTPIASASTYTPVAGLASLYGGLTSWSGGNVAIYYAQPTDPQVAILYNPNTWYNIYTGVWQQSGNSATVEQQILASSSMTNPIPGNPYSTQTAGLYWNSTPSGLPASYNAWHQAPGQTLYAYIPAGTLPPADSDGQTVIIQPDGTALELYAPVVLSSGQWISEMFSETNALSGLGVGAEDGRRASMIENYAGAVRDIDVTSGTIDHALAIVVPGSMLAQAFTGPALAFDSNSSDYSGTLPMGAHLALPTSLNLSSLDLQTSFGLELATAAQTYGMFVVDRGGSGVSVVTQNNPTTSALGNWSWAEQQDLNAIVHAAQLVH